MKTLAFVLLQAAQQAAPAADGASARPGASSWSMWVMLALIFVVMYFFMIHPQRKQQKELAEFRKSLQKGDKIVTIGGIYGEILEADENAPTVLVRVDGDVKIRFDKSAIQKVPGAPAEKK